MKKYFFLLVTAVALSVCFACEKSTDNEPNPDNESSNNTGTGETKEDDAIVGEDGNEESKANENNIFGLFKISIPKEYENNEMPGPLYIGIYPKEDDRIAYTKVYWLKTTNTFGWGYVGFSSYKIGSGVFISEIISLETRKECYALKWVCASKTANNPVGIKCYITRGEKEFHVGIARESLSSMPALIAEQFKSYKNEDGPIFGDDEDDDPEDPENPGDDDPVETDYSKPLIGRWKAGDILKDGLKEYYFLDNGKGYYEENRIRKAYGVRRIAFTWEAEKDLIHINYDKDGWRNEKSDYEYSIYGSTLKLRYSTSTLTEEFDHMDSSGTTTKDYTEKPFADNYIMDKDQHWYYEITKMQSGCEHASSSSSSNEKYIHFFGDDGLLTNAGMRIFYWTPYYEGIDGTWGSGSYPIAVSSGTLWVYNSMYYLNGIQETGRKGDKFTIKKEGNLTIYDYNGSSVKLHVVVSK